MTFEEFEAGLRAALAGELPGLDAQLRLAPRPRGDWPEGLSADSARPAAALVLLYPFEDDVALLLTVRASTLPQHAGQVSLPGGRIDGFESVEQAALREAAEEIGLRPADVRVIGQLTPLHIPVSGFHLHPVVAVADTRPSLHPAPGEVERILEVPLARLRDPALVQVAVRLRDNLPVEYAYFDVSGYQVWGATAMVLAELLAVLGTTPERPR